MRTSFFGLEIGRRAIQAQRVGLDVTAHNIANANTPGYSRQVARLRTAAPYTVPAFNRPGTVGQMGTGVKVDQIVRMHDSFVQFQINQESQARGYWEKRQQVLEELELLFLEPTDVGLRNAVDQFWQALQDLSRSPESEATRAVVRERAMVLTETVRNTYAQFHPLLRNIDSQIRSGAARINALGEQIARINAEIRKVIAAGDSPNDLLDQRDMLIEELAGLVDVNVIDRGGGMVAVAIGGVTLVEGISWRSIEVHEEPGTGMATLLWEGTQKPVQISSGELGALFEARDVDIPEYMEQLNEFARTLIKTINEIHEEGYGLNDLDDLNNEPPVEDGAGRRFFKDERDDPSYMTNAAEFFSLSDDILLDVGNIAASRNGEEGDGSNAMRMAQALQQPLFGGGRVTPGEYLGSMVASIGVKSEMAMSMRQHQEVLIGHLERLRASVSGVSLDEEMANMVQFQHAYTAAARLITTVDEAIDTIINRMGLVGR